MIITLLKTIDNIGRMDWPKRCVNYTNNKKEFNSPKKTFLNGKINLFFRKRSNLFDKILYNSIQVLKSLTFTFFDYQLFYYNITHHIKNITHFILL